MILTSIAQTTLPPGTIPHHVDIGPDEWFYSLVIGPGEGGFVLVGS